MTDALLVPWKLRGVSGAVLGPSLGRDTGGLQASRPHRQGIQLGCGPSYISASKPTRALSRPPGWVSMGQADASGGSHILSCPRGAISRVTRSDMGSRCSQGTAVWQTSPLTSPWGLTSPSCVRHRGSECWSLCFLVYTLILM